MMILATAGIIACQSSQQHEVKDARN